MLAYKRDVWLNNMMIMIVRQKNESVGQGIFFAVACKTRVAGDCLQAFMTE